MAKTSMITTRVEPAIKESADTILKDLGLSVSEAITLFLHQVVLQEGIPFEVKNPNRRTRQAMKNALEGKNLQHYSSINDLRREFQ